MEQYRRKSISSANHFVVIYMNNVQVTRTVAKSIRHQDFAIYFTGIKDLVESSKVKSVRGSDSRLVFGIQLSDFPKSFTARLFEQVIFMIIKDG